MKKPIRNVMFRGVAQVGETHATFTLTNWDRENTLTSDLIEGGTLRIKLNRDGGDIFLSFPLKGFESSWNEAKALCDLAYQKKSDSEYFQ
jgi:hypothetical protein